MPTTVVFSSTGAMQTFAVPATAISPITVELTGAGGGAGGPAGVAPLGGVGGHVVGTLNVVPGVDVLSISVGARGGNGSTAPPFGGGGGGGNATGAVGSSGGGASDIRLNGTGLAQRVAVAGGGGAAGRSTSGIAVVGGAGGAATGHAGVAGSAAGSTAAGGGTAAAGGSAGAGSTGGSGGTSGQGGTGGTNAGASAFGGGGGGGGFFGGGGGGSNTAGNASGSGGGGSNYVGGLASATTNTQGGGAASATNGQVIITYNQAPGPPVIFLPLTAYTYVMLPTLFEWVANDPDGDTIVSSDFRYRLIGAPTWTTINTTVGAGGSFGAILFEPNTLAAGSYEAQVRTNDSDGLTSPYSASYLFDMRPQPAAVYPYADVPDQWLNYEDVPHVIDADDMQARISDRINRLAFKIAMWTRDDDVDLTRGADVGWDITLTANTAVAANAVIPFDGQANLSPRATIPLFGVVGVALPGTYLIGFSVKQTGSVAFTAQLMGLPASYGVPTAGCAGVAGVSATLDPIPVKLLGGETLTIVPAQAITVAGTVSGHVVSHFHGWRIGE